MKSRFVFSQTAWDRFKFFVKGPSSIVHQSQAEAKAFRDNVWDPELKKLLDQYISACDKGVGFHGIADRDDKLSQKIIRGEVNTNSDLRNWANSQISILKADGKGNNKSVFELLKNIGTKAVSKKPSSSSSSGVSSADNSKTQSTDASKSPIIKPKNDTSKLEEKNNVNKTVNNVVPKVYNHKNKSSGESSDFKYLENKMESYRVDEPKRPLDYSDYFDKIRTGNDFLFLAISKVFPEIQVYGKDPIQKHKIEQYWKIENKEKIKSKLIEISENPWINKNYPHIPLLLPDAITKLDQKIVQI